MSFKTAIDQTPLLRNHLRDGLQALGSNSSNIKPNDTRKCEGSVDIDNAVKQEFSSNNRWDYAVGYDGKTYFIEIHPADTSEVKTILKKLGWLKVFLSEKAPELNKEPKSFHWVASKGNHILSNSPQYRQLALSGITVVGQLTLK